MCTPMPAQKAQTALGASAASDGARVRALGQVQWGWRSSAGAQDCRNYTAQFTLSKNLPIIMCAAKNPASFLQQFQFAEARAEEEPSQPV